MVSDTWPLPAIQDLLEDFGGRSIFTTRDLLKGFNQIAVHGSSIPKLTMATPWGKFSYRVMPFGVINGPSCFSRAIYMAMQGYLNDFVATYIDDVVIYSWDFDEHVDHCRKVLERLRAVRMKIKPSKCSFAQGEVEFLGFLVSARSVRPNPKKAEKMLKFPKTSKSH